jgi:hypothetical protein
MQCLGIDDLTCLVMTLDEVQEFAWLFLQNKEAIERADIVRDADGTFALAVIRMDGSEETFRSAEEASWASALQTGEQMREGGLFAILGEDGNPVLCDFKTREAWILANAEKTKEKIECSPDVEATILFSGHSPSRISMDGSPKFWATWFYNSAQNQHYCCGPGVFETRVAAESFVKYYISTGCPAPGTPEFVCLGSG